MSSVEEIATYLGLIVQSAGGEIRVPFGVAEAGLPEGHAVRIWMDTQEEEMVFTLADVREAASAEQ